MTIATLKAGTEINFRFGTATLRTESAVLLPNYALDPRKVMRPLTGEYVDLPMISPTNIRSSVRLANPMNFRRADAKPGDTMLCGGSTNGIGDEIMAWPIVHHLINQIRLSVTVVVEPGMEGLWHRMPGLKVAMYPLPTDFAFSFQWWNFSSHGANRIKHPTDRRFDLLGFDLQGIPPDQKVFAMPVSGEALDMVKNLTNNRPFAVYVPFACSPIRSLTRRKSREMIIALAKAFPQFLWLVPGIREQLAWLAVDGKLPDNALLVTTSIDHLMATIKTARLVVTPDTGPMHLAGNYGTPCISFFGPVPPQERVSYYSNHTAIYKTAVCPLAPCYINKDDCPDGCPSAEQRCCAVMEAITEDEVIEAARRYLSA